jgi:very-short-patch-repair endonuclease
MSERRRGEKQALEDEFAFLVHVCGLPAPVRQFKFLPYRRFRFDFAWPDFKVFVEIEGGTWVGGRHVRPTGYARDCEKYNEAALNGWVGLRFTSDMLRNDPSGCISKLATLLEQRGADLSGFLEIPKKRGGKDGGSQDA